MSTALLSTRTKMEWGFPGSVPVRHLLGLVDAMEELDPGLCRGRPRLEGQECTVVQPEIDLNVPPCVIQGHAVVNDDFRTYTRRIRAFGI